ncbi:hypothetical protein POJ06DRAFT_150566 [Lipomyces tetrasporus]|uniref:Uncharacterized protein n=1 Tax=Lipomyces tetrasporus TaxID=54092 RepID=A0AAD7QRE0_9ASCO|nr:uncharacterized protein POJ06DRAFT_150566 [Lipomyces tetrasporus]KAJ8098387.1 hypothetical protein POJ06DRAFT_150566 [Lipomyces tetrasporus]
MVLHNNKWDRKATRAYNRKHGIPPPSRGPRQEAEPSSDDEDAVSGSEASVSDSDGTNVLDNENTTSEAATTSFVPVRRRKKLPSNAWRYENQEADEELDVEAAAKDTEDAYLASIARPADGGLSKYLVDNDKNEKVAENLEEVRDIFETQLNVGELIGGGKKKKVFAKVPEESKSKGRIVTYDAADPQFRDADRRIEKLKYTDTVRERYKSANRKEIEGELDRLKRLPQSVAAPKLKERRAAGLQRDAAGLNEDFDKFWNDMEKKGNDGANGGSAVVGEFTSKAATVKPMWDAASKTSGSVYIDASKTSTPVKLKKTTTDAEDKFLDDLLNGN